MDIDVHYSCFDDNSINELILEVLRSQFCCRIVHFTYLMDKDIESDSDSTNGSLNPILVMVFVGLITLLILLKVDNNHYRSLELQAQSKG